MNMNPASISFPARETTLQAKLFSEPALYTYAILDGASIPGLIARLKDVGESACLYRGEMAPDLAACAPYLVLLKPRTEFTCWLLGGFGQHWGIFVQSEVDLWTLRRHLRAFLLVHEITGRTLYFRYYDPRVLRRYLPTCNEAELSTVFGPIQRFFSESEDVSQLLEFSLRDSQLHSEIFALPARI